MPYKESCKEVYERINYHMKYWNTDKITQYYYTYKDDRSNSAEVLEVLVGDQGESVQDFRAVKRWDRDEVEYSEDNVYLHGDIEQRKDDLEGAASESQVQLGDRGHYQPDECSD